MKGKTQNFTLKSNMKIVDRDSIRQTHIIRHVHNAHFPGLQHAFNFFLNEKVRSCKCFPQEGNIPTLAYNMVNSVIIILALYVCFVDRCLSFCPYSFDHCVVCPSSIYGFWFPLWYLQTLLTAKQLN